MTSLGVQTTLEDVAQLEQAGFNAWPALQTLFSGPWVLRMANGVTKRANSLNTLGPEHDTPEALRHRLDQAEALFRRNGLTPVFRVSPLTSAATVAEVRRRGWTERDPSLVLHGTLDRALHGALAECETRPNPGLLSDHPTAAWLKAHAAVDGLSPQTCCTLKSILTKIALPKAFASVPAGGHVGSVALAVADGPLLGLFCVGTLPEARRQGLSQRALNALLHWGKEQGANRLWLQVGAANTGALALYARMGLTPAYGYTYWVCPPPA